MTRITKEQAYCINCKYYGIDAQHCELHDKHSNIMGHCTSFLKGKKSKYNAIRTKVDNFMFDSKLEAKRYEQLKIEQQAGFVKFFLRQVPFHLHDGTIYRVDFDITYTDGHRVFEDVKGQLTEVSRLKIRMVEDQYDGVKIFINKMGK